MSKILTRLARTMITRPHAIRKKCDCTILERGKAKENVYFLKEEQLCLRQLRAKIRREERELTAVIKANKQKLKKLSGSGEDEHQAGDCDCVDDHEK